MILGGRAGGQYGIVIEMTNLKHQNPQSVGVMASSGWCEHYLVCRRLLTILRGKGRIRQFAIPPGFSTQNCAPPINVLSSDRCNWVGVFTVIAKDILAISEDFFCTKKKYVFSQLEMKLTQPYESEIQCNLYAIMRKYWYLSKIHIACCSCSEFILCGTHSFSVLHVLFLLFFSA